MKTLLRQLRLTALALLFAGTALHGAHHLLDQGCHADAATPSHPCSVCHSLHGGVVAAQALDSAPPAWRPPAALRDVEPLRPALAPPYRAPGRAPPAA